MRKIRNVPILFYISAALAAVCGVVHRLFYLSSDFADKFNSTVGKAYRFCLAKITNALPFSLAEFLLFSSPVIIVMACVAICRYSSRSRTHLIRAVCYVLCVPLIIYSMFAVGFASGYRGADMLEKSGLSAKEVNAESLYETLMQVISGLNAECGNVDFTADGSSVMPFEIMELGNELDGAYAVVAEKYPFIDDYKSSVKPLVISKLMTYTHISGIYTFFTGEANINTNYPDYITVYTAAHEMAHQRGISKEDEANFTAFLVCSSSENSYIRYCAYMNMYSYLANELYDADRSLFSSAYGSLDANAQRELAAYGRFFEKYRDNKASEISNTFNEAYLKSQGTEGVKSYDLVVRLAVAYYSE